MKNKLLILVALTAILAALCVSIVVSDNRSKAQPADTPQVISLKAQLKKSQDQMKLHDGVNNTAIKNAGDLIQGQNQKITTLCTQIKAAKLTQPLCQ
jgi:hypothetical protein